MSFSIFEIGNKFILCSKEQLFVCRVNNTLIYHSGKPESSNIFVRLVFFLLSNLSRPIATEVPEPKVFHAYKLYQTINHKLILKYKTYVYVDESFVENFSLAFNIL